jgi:hypothetical protein
MVTFKRSSWSPIHLFCVETTHFLGGDGHEQLPLLYRRIGSRIPFVGAVRQIRNDFDEALSEPGTRYRDILSLFLLNQTLGVGIQTRTSKDKLTDRGLSQKNKHASTMCQSATPKTKLGLHLVQPRTLDVFSRQ